MCSMAHLKQVKAMAIGAADRLVRHAKITCLQMAEVNALGAACRLHRAASEPGSYKGQVQEGQGCF